MAIFFLIQSKLGRFGDDEDNPPTPSDDSEFDDDEDPDNLGVPGIYNQILFIKLLLRQYNNISI